MSTSRQHPRGSWPVLLILALATLGTLLVLIDSYLNHQRDIQNCQMSYSRPGFVKVAPGPTSRLATKYTLYLYREGLIDSQHQVHRNTRSRRVYLDLKKKAGFS